MKTNTRIEPFIRRLPLVAATFFIATLCVCTTANAGMEPKSMEIAQPEPFSWTGFYFGLNAGIVLTDFDTGDYESVVDLERQFGDRMQNNVAPAVNTPSGDFSPFAFFSGSGGGGTDVEPKVGFDLGYMKQWGHFVVGGSISFGGTHTEARTHFSEFQENFILADGANSAPSGREVLAETEFTSSRRVEQTWSGSVGGQLGYAMDHWLFYATGGAAFAQIEVRSFDRAITDFFIDDFATSGPVATTVRQQPNGGNNGFIGEAIDRLRRSSGSIQDGWFAGFGLMYAFANNMSAGVEYRHVEFGDETYHFKDDGTIFPGKTPVSVNNDEILFKLTWLLGSRLHK